jgi:hypothetical protein
MQSALEQGNVYLFPEFRFRNGGTSDKLLILLTKSTAINKLIVLCKTTSQEKPYRKKEFGCNEDKAYFYIPKERDLFDLDTWFILDELYPCTPDDMIQYHFQEKLHFIGKLKYEHIRALINCLKAIGTEEIYLEVID